MQEKSAAEQLKTLKKALDGKVSLITFAAIYHSL